MHRGGMLDVSFCPFTPAPCLVMLTKAPTCMQSFVLAPPAYARCSNQSSHLSSSLQGQSSGPCSPPDPAHRVVSTPVIPTCSHRVTRVPNVGQQGAARLSAIQLPPLLTVLPYSILMSMQCLAYPTANLHPEVMHMRSCQMYLSLIPHIRSK